MPSPRDQYDPPFDSRHKGNTVSMIGDEKRHNVPFSKPAHPV
jgi:hypothetical protein